MLDAQNNRLIETVLLSTDNICFVEKLFYALLTSPELINYTFQRANNKGADMQTGLHLCCSNISCIKVQITYTIWASTDFGNKHMHISLLQTPMLMYPARLEV